MLEIAICVFIFLVILALAVLVYFLNKVNDPTVFSFDETTLTLFDKKPIAIPFGKIKRINRGMADGEYGGILHIHYYITFENLEGKEEVVQLKRSALDIKLWERFKVALSCSNPNVLIKESLL